MSGILSATILSSGGDSSFWILSVGYTGTTDLEFIDVTTDTSGNLYLAGMDYVNEKAFVAKVTTNATISWQNTYNYSSGYSRFYGISKDSSGNIYPAGYVYNTASPAWYFSIAKVSQSTGSISFQRFLGTTSLNSRFYSSSVDASGNVYGFGLRTPSSGNPRMFLAKYTSAGSLSSQNYLSSADSIGYSVTTDSSSNVYISGDETNGVFAKLNSSLVSSWGYKLTKTSSVVSCGTIFVDSSGNVYICGDFTGTNSSAFVHKYNSSGTLQWGRQISASGSDVLGNAVTVDSTGNVYLLCDVGTDNVAIIKYNSSGTLLWQRNMTNFYTGSAITISPGGSPIFCGISNEAVYTAVAVKVPSDGSKTGTYTNGKSGGTYVYSTSSYTDAATTLTASSWSPTLTAQTMTDSAGSLAATTSSYTTAVANL